MTDPLSLRVHDAVLAALQEQTNLDVLDGAVGELGQPKYRMDEEGAHITAVLWWSSDTASPDDESLAGTRALRGISWQVTAVGGDQNRAVRAADKVRAALEGVRLTSFTGRVRLDPTGTVQKDESVTPHARFLPMVFRVDVNPTAAQGD